MPSHSLGKMKDSPTLTMSEMLVLHALILKARSSHTVCIFVIRTLLYRIASVIYSQNEVLIEPLYIIHHNN